MKDAMYLPSRREMFPLVLAGAISGKAEVPAPRRIVLKASDGVNVYAWHYAAADRARPAILLFHQAGSNHAEYETIAPRLVTLGYHALALDQRSGGRMWGQANRTAAQFAKEVGYLSVLPDLEAALAWPVTQGLPSRSIIWGSSYSAALVFLVAARHPSAVAAVLASFTECSSPKYSPGENARTAATADGCRAATRNTSAAE